ncbi:unnamed protein product [Strongylus vulgaris]|uniref:P-type ATPase A domain-containing protein n=1 Tax=Strongylus vulgaris TaxID=40348 RepID=A0A3P7JFT4_STRVU|nr:unnamed protein product [Strongylus vulgaris]
MTLKGHCKGNCRIKHCRGKHLTPGGKNCLYHDFVPALAIDPEVGFCGRWRRKRKVGPAETDVAEARQAVGTSFVEHHLTIEQLKDLYPDSFIHDQFPERSDGLHTEEASSGSRIPADIRILQTNCLTIEVSEVTGYRSTSERKITLGHTSPVECTAEAAAPHVSVFDSRNVAFKGSYCTEGDGLGIVIRTGKFTVLGGIANLHTHMPPIKSKLQTELRTFANFITILAICMAVAMFLIGCIVAKFENVLDHFVIGFLVVIVANVPQGLPATVMSQLRIIARRMAQKNIYIKKLDLIDELGAATVICADKSGTLTMNQMVVTDLWYNGRMITALITVYAI